MQTAVDIGTLIVQAPGICGGRPRIAGTRITVQNVAIDFNVGMKPEAIVSERAHLTQTQVYAALAYYYANKEAIDAEIAAYYKEFDHLEVEHLEELAQRGNRTAYEAVLVKVPDVEPEPYDQLPPA
jgi:uncharacterized protein (DUF433 family)